MALSTRQLRHMYEVFGDDIEYMSGLEMLQTLIEMSELYSGEEQELPQNVIKVDFSMNRRMV